MFCLFDSWSLRLWRPRRGIETLMTKGNIHSGASMFKIVKTTKRYWNSARVILQDDSLFCLRLWRPRRGIETLTTKFLWLLLNKFKIVKTTKRYWNIFRNLATQSYSEFKIVKTTKRYWNILLGCLNNLPLLRLRLWRPRRGIETSFLSYTYRDQVPRLRLWRPRRGIETRK